MVSMPRTEAECVFGGIDTHKQTHTAAVLDAAGELLDTTTFPTTRAGNQALLGWLEQHGSVQRVGIEQTGSYGAGIARLVTSHAIEVVEVTRPDTAARRSHGKDDTLDAIAAAEAAWSRRRVQPAKHRDGVVEALRSLRVARTSAVRMRRQAQQQLDSLLVSAPDDVREPLRDLTRTPLLRACAALAPDPDAAHQPAVAVQLAVRSLAGRIVDLTSEIRLLEQHINPLVAEHAAPLLELAGVGIETAAQLLITAGDNPDRLRSDAAFAKLCGVAPLPASTGQKTSRHRLNRGGDRNANSALHIIAVTRLRVCPHTRAYADRRRQQGLTNREILRCLKRYISREIYYRLTA
jgi:transposase